MNIPYYGLDKNKFNRICIYSSTKKIWDSLKIIYKDTNEMKKKIKN